MCGDQYGWGQLAIPTVYYTYRIHCHCLDI